VLTTFYIVITLLSGHTIAPGLMEYCTVTVHASTAGALKQGCVAKP
jgi:hypothetical protein